MADNAQTGGQHHLCLTPASILQRVSEDGSTIGPTPERRDALALYSERAATVSFQAVLTAGDVAVTNVVVSAETFIGRTSDQINADRVELFRQCYVKVIRPEGTQIAGNHEITRFRAKYPGVGEGWMPDPILPMDTFDMYPRQVVGIWGNIRVPADLKPGRYYSRVVVRGDTETGVTTDSVMIDLVVATASIPAKPTSPNSFGFGVSDRLSGINLYYPDDDLSERLGQYMDVLADHRINSLFYGRFNRDDTLLPVVDEPSRVRYDFTKIEPLVRRLHELGFTFNIWPCSFWYDATLSMDLWKPLERFRDRVDSFFDDEAVDDFLVQLFDSYNEFLVKNGWQDVGFCYVWDEPRSIEHLEHGKRIIRRIRKINPNVKTTIAVSGDLLDRILDEDEKLYDIVAFHMSCYDETQFDRMKERGIERWWYCSNWTSSSISFFVDEPPHHWRLIYWLTWKYGLDGFVYWNANSWNYDRYTYGNIDNRSSITFPRSDWNVNCWNGGPQQHSSGKGAGDGTLVYPGPDGPISSLRLEMIRLGMQDWEVFKALEKASTSDAVDGSLRGEIGKFLVCLRSWIGTPNHYPSDAWDMDAFRQRAGRLLDQAVIGATGKKTDIVEFY